MIFSIEVSCRKHNLRRVRSFVNEILENHYRLDACNANLLVLAIDELCANLMIHSHQCNPSDLIEVRITNDQYNFVFEIHDQSNDTFNLLEYKIPDMKQIIKDKKNGGIGLILVKKIMDDIQFEKRGEHNICRLYKSFPTRASA